MTDLGAIGGVTLTQLAYLVAVDTHRHFGAAAAACNVTQPTLSMQIAKLERALETTLLDRSRTPVVPTDAGRAVIAQARVVLREAARLGDLRTARAGELAGEVRFGVIPTLAPYLLPRMLPELRRRHPRIELVVEERVTDDVLDLVRRDHLDAGLVATAAPSDLAERRLFTEPFVAYVSAGHRLAREAHVRTADLSLDDLWLLSEGHCFRAQTVRLCRQRSRGGRSVAADACTTGARFESGNLETLVRLVEGGSGMTLLPALAAEGLRSAAQRRLVRPFAAPVPSREVGLVRRRAGAREHLVEAVTAVLLEALPDALRTNPSQGRAS